MKPTIPFFITIFLLTYISAFTQDYLPIAQENTIWFMEYTDYSSSTPQLKKYLYFTQGDTLVNNQAYKKLYYQNMEGSSPKIVAGIRDDETEQKTYGIVLTTEDIIGTWLHYSCPSNQEILLYDFKLNIGEYFPSNCVSGGGTVTDTSTTQLYGVSRKTTAISSVYQTWYEGIGSTSGLLSSLWDFSDHQLYDYCQGTFDQCGAPLWLNTNAVLAQERGKVFPNPTAGILTVQVKEYVRNGNMVITDLYGQIVKTYPFDALEQKLEISELASGMYFVQVYNNDRMIYKARVLKQ